MLTFDRVGIALTALHVSKSEHSNSNNVHNFADDFASIERAFVLTNSKALQQRVSARSATAAAAAADARAAAAEAERAKLTAVVTQQTRFAVEQHHRSAQAEAANAALREELDDTRRRLQQVTGRLQIDCTCRYL